MDEISQAYGSASKPVEHLLGTTVSPEDPDRAIIEPWAKTVSGPILDVGAGTGRWTGHLTNLGYDVTGVEPAKRLVTVARQVHPEAHFRVGSIADLTHPQHRWAGILAWYSIIHMGPEELPSALTTLRDALTDDGTMLLSFFWGPYLELFDHPVAPAYRWPMPRMVHTLNAVGFEVIEQRQNAASPHAYVIVQPKQS